MRLRSTAWDGPAPSAGDVLVDDDGQHLLVERVAAGAGIGHFTIDVRPLGRVYRWHESATAST